MKKAPDLFSNKLFDVEHALNIFAYSYVTLPGNQIYNVDRLKQHQDLIDNCHIYFIGYLPKIELIEVDQIERKLITHFLVAGQPRDLEWELPDGFNLEREGELFWVETPDGKRTFPNQEASVFRLHTNSPMEFKVQYIGQAYGENGERNALDRLIKHETLQKIALQKPPENHEIQLLLVEIQPNNRMMTIFNPWAEIKDDDGNRIKNALDSLFNTTEIQQIALYEAALIRYFQPKYNRIFRDSFPSTNLKVLKQCYDKDMAAVIAEFCIDEIPFYLSSETVDAMWTHIAGYNIHGTLERDIFFGKESGHLQNLSSPKM